MTFKSTNVESTITYIKVKPEGCTYPELVAAEELESNCYRLIENPIQSCSLNYGTIIVAMMNVEGELELVAIAEPSVYKTRMFLRSASLNKQELLDKIGKPVVAAGGFWECNCAGIVFAHVPKGSAFDLDALFQQNNYYPMELTELHSVNMGEA